MSILVYSLSTFERIFADDDGGQFVEDQVLHAPAPVGFADAVEARIGFNLDQIQSQVPRTIMHLTPVIFTFFCMTGRRPRLWGRQKADLRGDRSARRRLETRGSRSLFDDRTDPCRRISPQPPLSPLAGCR